LDPSLTVLGKLLEQLFKDSPMPVYMKDLENRWIFSNLECCRVLGIPPEVLRPGSSVRETLAPEVAEMFVANDREVLDSRSPISFEEQVPDAGTGELLRYISVKFPLRGEHDELIGVGGISFDASDQYRRERELEFSRAMVATVFSALRAGILVVQISDDDSDSKVIDCNEAFCALTGRTREELLGQSGAAVVHPESVPARDQLLANIIAGNMTVTELRYLRPDGTDVWVLTIPATTSGPAGERLIVVQAIDITERREFERQLRHYADHDSLTGLFSRRHFNERLEDQVGRVKSTRRPASLLLLDLDGFKDVNDALGHSTGDALLRRLAGALTSALREDELLARVGGDEFAVLLPDASGEQALRVGEKLAGAVYDNGAVNTPAGRIQVTVSVGVTSWSDEHQIHAEMLMAEADIAMYDAKAAGRNRTCIYERGRHRPGEIATRSSRLTHLREAIANGHFVLHAQPIVPLSASPTTSAAAPGMYELLVRMRRADGTLAAPGEFLPDAERHGLIADIDRWVLAEAVRVLKLRRVAGKPINVSVNLCAASIEDPLLGDVIAALLATNDVPPEMLTLELTETGALSDLGQASELSLRLREIGCHFALDDFGAAFASLQYLKHIRFDLVKIDGEFIRDLPRSPADQLIVKAVAEMATGFGAKVVAEFVDSQDTVDLLRQFRVEFGQGYFLGRPEPLSLS
jgi:diguanylate cyclase (GGDEF)-like protein/PAS domain S-box-containing protein